MTKKTDENGIIIFNAISKEEDLRLTGYRAIINPPPGDGRCHVCGKHISELTPFGGPGDPLVDDFSGELLVKTFRRSYMYDEEAGKAWEEADKAMEEASGLNDPLPWFIAKYGEEKGKNFYEAKRGRIWGWVNPSWECRDCIVLDDFESDQKLAKRILGDECSVNVQKNAEEVVKR